MLHSNRLLTQMQGKIVARKIPNRATMILWKDNPNLMDVLETEKALKLKK